MGEDPPCDATPSSGQRGRPWVTRQGGRNVCGANCRRQHTHTYTEYLQPQHMPPHIGCAVSKRSSERGWDGIVARSRKVRGTRVTTTAIFRGLASTAEEWWAASRSRPTYALPRVSPLKIPLSGEQRQRQTANSGCRAFSCNWVVSPLPRVRVLCSVIGHGSGHKLGAVHPSTMDLFRFRIQKSTAGGSSY